MSEDEYDDELPRVHLRPRDPVSSTTHQASSAPIVIVMKRFIQAEWVMPSAGAVASEREREQTTERELRLLRLQHEHVADAAVREEGTVRAARPPHSDSSSSEGEALAVAVTALREHAAPPSYKDGATIAADFLSALRAQQPYSDDRLLSSYLEVLHSNHCTIRAVTNDVSSTTISPTFALQMCAVNLLICILSTRSNHSLLYPGHYIFHTPRLAYYTVQQSIFKINIAHAGQS